MKESHTTTPRPQKPRSTVSEKQKSENVMPLMVVVTAVLLEVVMVVVVVVVVVVAGVDLRQPDSGSDCLTKSYGQ